jgi:hypothetical protein
VRAAPLKERKALLEKVVRRYGLQKSEPVLGDGRVAFRAVCALGLEETWRSGSGIRRGPSGGRSSTGIIRRRDPTLARAL